MTDIFSIETTLKLIAAVEQIKPPATFLADTFFSQNELVGQDLIAVESKKVGRKLAPYVVENTRGRAMAREKTQVRWYKVPLFCPQRVIGLNDITRRQFGELPELYSPVSLEDRAQRLIAADLADLMRLHANRRGAMAAEILQTGKLEVKGYADDGLITTSDVIDFQFTNEITPAVSWSSNGAAIYDDLKSASEKIQREAGQIPTVAVCGRNIEKYLLSNKELLQWLMLPNRENLSLMNLKPQFTSAEVRHIGYISSLNLELVSYAQTYTDDTGATRFFIEPDNVIMGVPGLGKMSYGAVTYFQRGEWRRVLAEHVPVYSYSEEAQTQTLSLYSRCLPVPLDVTSWAVIKSCD